MYAITYTLIRNINKKNLEISFSLIYTTLLVVSVWVICGTVFYHYNAGMSFNNAFYYAVQAGISIGFGNVSEPDQDSIHIFSIFYILCGSSIVTGCMSTIIGIVLQPEFVDLRLAFKQKTAYSVSPYDYNNKITIKSILFFLWYQIKYWIGWYHTPKRTILWILWVLWILFGAFWWMYSNNYTWDPTPHPTFIQGLFFAVTSCSTAGIYGPFCMDPSTNNSNKCILSEEQSIFVGLYVLVGVPLYAASLAEFATIPINHILTKKWSNSLHQPLRKKEFDYAAGLLSTGDNTNVLSKGEYIIVELMKLGNIKANELQLIMQKFIELDVDKLGYVTSDQLVKSGYLYEDKDEPNLSDNNHVIHVNETNVSVSRSELTLI